jgi:hypothetical protein
MCYLCLPSRSKNTQEQSNITTPSRKHKYESDDETIYPVVPYQNPIDDDRASYYRKLERYAKRQKQKMLNRYEEEGYQSDENRYPHRRNADYNCGREHKSSNSYNQSSNSWNQSSNSCYQSNNCQSLKPQVLYGRPMQNGGLWDKYHTYQVTKACSDHYH